MLWALVCSLGLGVMFSCDEVTEEEGPIPTVPPTGGDTPATTPTPTDTTVTIEAILSVDKAEIEVSAAGGEITFITTTNVAYTVSEDSEWISITSDGRAETRDYTVVATVEANKGEAREAVITVTAEGAEAKTVTIKQAAYVASDIVYPEFKTPTYIVDTMTMAAYSIDVTSGIQEIHVVSAKGYAYNVSGDEAAEWYSITAKEDGTTCVKITVNEGKDPRTCALTINVSGESDMQIAFAINQDGRENTNVLKTPNIGIDCSAQQITVVASTGVQYMIRPQDEWITVVDNGRAVTDHEIVFAVAENESLTRIGSIWIIFKNGDKQQNWDTAVCVVTQEETPNLPFTTTFSEWPEYANAPYYNFAEANEGKEWPEPTKIFALNRYVSSTADQEKLYIQEDRRWAFVGGPVRYNAKVNSESVTPMLDEFNYQFDFLREKMGWPPIKTESDGYRNHIILHESGLRGQGKDSLATGGWQSTFNGYPVVLLSYVPVAAWNPATPDDYQTGACIHEGIHAVFATLPGCKNAAWFHEGANTWLQAQMNIEMALEEGSTSLEQLQRKGEFGYLCMGSILAPFMPIECYSGWLTTDNSFGGPAAQGNNDRLCTRNLIGGVQYSSVFPTFMSVAMSKYSVAKIWETSFSGYILDRIEDFIGDAETRRMVIEYRARLCLADMKEWTGAVKNMYNSNWGISITPERTEYSGQQKAWTCYPYVKTTKDSEGWYKPDDYTLPGWTGANIIPFTVSGDTIAFKFEELYDGEPLYEGTKSPAGSNLYRADGDTRFMVCWNGTDGTPYYSQTANHGEQLIIDMTGKQAANNVVFVMAINTDWYYTGDKIRKAKYDFRVKPTYGIKDKASISKKWYNWSAKL